MCCCHFDKRGVAFALGLVEVEGFGEGLDDGVESGAAATEPATPSAIAAADMDKNDRFNYNPFIWRNIVET